MRAKRKAGYPSGQRELTVNQPSDDYGGSNPSPATTGPGSPGPRLFSGLVLPPRAGTLRGMSSVIAASVASALFGVEAVTLAQHIADVLGESAVDYDLEGVESDLRAVIDQALPAGVSLEGESLVVADGVAADLAAVRDGVGWVDVHTVALSHDMAGPGA